MREVKYGKFDQKISRLLTHHRTIYVTIQLSDVDNLSIPINRITSLSIPNESNSNACYAVQSFFVQLGATESSESTYSLG